MAKKATGEVCLADGENAHQHWQIALGVRVGGKWSALPTGFGLRVAVEAPNGYADGPNWSSSGEYRNKL